MHFNCFLSVIFIYKTSSRSNDLVLRWMVFNWNYYFQYPNKLWNNSLHINNLTSAVIKENIEKNKVKEEYKKISS